MISLADVPRGRGGSWITPQMLAFAAIMGTAPLWLGPIGLYEYLGVEVVIWIIYALGFNLLFGYAGLHSFGHGAYFGIGAYAFGLFQHNVVVSLWGGLGAAILAGVLAGAIVGAIVCHRRGIYFALAVYIVMSTWAMFMVDVRQFYVMAIIIGCVQGGAQGLSRSLYASLIPPDQPGEFFGFYTLLTKFAHVLGPVLVAVAAMLSDDPKWVLLALMPLFIGGGMLLTVVRGGRAIAARAGIHRLGAVAANFGATTKSGQDLESPAGNATSSAIKAGRPSAPSQRSRHPASAPADSAP